MCKRLMCKRLMCKRLMCKSVALVQAEVVFCVQEFMSGGSLDCQLWHTPVASVTWPERVQWACDIAEAFHAA